MKVTIIIKMTIRQMHIRQRYFRRIRLWKILIESGISNHMGLMGFNHQNKLVHLRFGDSPSTTQLKNYYTKKPSLVGSNRCTYLADRPQSSKYIGIPQHYTYSDRCGRIRFSLFILVYLIQFNPGYKFVLWISRWGNKSPP